MPPNIPLLLNCAQHPVFADAREANTGILENHGDDVNIGFKIALSGKLSLRYIKLLLWRIEEALILHIL